MTIADDARAAAFNFEAVKSAYRQVKEGMSVTLVIHPDEMPPELATAPLGARYRVGMVEMGVDETPVSRDPGRTAPESRPPASPAHPPANPSEPAGANPRSIAARERYATESEMERARDRAGMLASDPRFQQWSGSRTKMEAAEYIRRSCRVKSRAEIADDPAACQIFEAMETDYLIDTKQMAAPR